MLARHSPHMNTAALIARDRLGKTMIADNENPTPIHEAIPEEEELMERSSAPTVLDLRAAFKDLFTDSDTIVEAEQDLTAPSDRAPHNQTNY